jgi:hypothetical protein
VENKLPRSGFVQHSKVDMLKAARSTVAEPVEPVE